jgi:hypothetical protein
MSGSGRSANSGRLLYASTPCKDKGDAPYWETVTRKSLVALRCDIGQCGRLPSEASGQQFGEPVARLLGDALEHEAQIRLGIDAVELGGFEPRQYRGGLATAVGAGEQDLLARWHPGPRIARSAALLSIWTARRHGSVSMPPSVRARS